MMHSDGVFIHNCSFVLFQAGHPCVLDAVDYTLHAIVESKVKGHVFECFSKCICKYHFLYFNRRDVFTGNDHHVSQKKRSKSRGQRNCTLNVYLHIRVVLFVILFDGRWNRSLSEKISLDFVGRIRGDPDWYGISLILRIRVGKIFHRCCDDSKKTPIGSKGVI